MSDLHAEAKRRAKAFWDSLTNEERFVLGDEMVLGSLDWSDWMSKKPLPGFWSAVDALRIAWEIETSK